MKRIANIFLLIIIGLQFSIPIEIDQDQAAKIKFDKTVHDFGRIKMGDKVVKCTFTYTNTGNDMLFISRVKTSCGCTEPEYSKEPLMPGESATFVVGYTASDIMGAFNKKITVFTNAVNNAVILTIKGFVEE
ncbi:MAG: hypothetical protein DRI84_07270 [Bacteroidetes bacterium]|nr:MAG: hypothetical protein DRI84_07270 [Bacteroidota bacterium]